MTPERQKKMDRIKHIAEAGMIISFALIIVVTVIPEIWKIEMPKAITTVLVSLLLLSLAVLLVSSFWATDKEKEEFKRAVKDAVQEAQEDEIRKKRRIPSDEQIKSPLKGLTPQQEAVIIDMLRNNILVENNRLKTSELKHLLLALERQGDLDVSDMDRVIAWVMQVTGYDVDARNLKYDYTAKYSDKEIVKWGNKIRERYDQIEMF